MVKEAEDHVKHDHWELVPRDKVPSGTKVMDTAWSMKRKQEIMKKRFCEHKALALGPDLRPKSNGGQTVSKL